MSTRARLWIVMAMLCAGATAIGLWGTAGQAIHQGDEAIYAQTARQIVEQRELIDLPWQQHLRFSRPPMAFWVLAAAHAQLGDERAVRWVNAGAQGVVAAATVWLGTALTGMLAVGAAAGAMLALSDLFVGYARFFESEPILCAFVVVAMAAYAMARRRGGGWIYLWGAALGGALMTKQLVGALPLLAPMVDRVARPDAGAERVSVRRVALAVLVAGVIVAPWHVLASLRHGARFWNELFIANVVERSTSAMHQATTRLFYARELWRSEGALAIGIAAAIVIGGARAVTTRAFSSVLLFAWAAGVFAIYSMAASRYDYYLLLAYPAFFLLVADAIYRLGTGRAQLRAVAVGAWILVAALHTLPRYLGSFRGEDEVRALVTRANGLVPASSPLYLFNTLPYAARYYSTHETRLLIESEKDYRDAQALDRHIIPVPGEFAPDLARDFAVRQRPFALLMPRRRAALLDGIAGLTIEGSTNHYLLVIAR